MQGHPHSLIQIAAFMRRNALRFPDRDAYITGGSRLISRISWHQADQASDRLAWRLRELGIARKDHVAILGNNSASYILVTYALHKLGAAAVILNAALKSGPLAAQVNHADAKAVVSGDGLQAVVNAVRGELDTQLLLTWDAEDRSDGVINLDAVLRNKEYAGPREPFPIEAVEPDDIACLIFSSGTTGTPKGAINTWWNLLSKNLTLAFSQELRNTDVGMFVTPLCMGGTQLMSINPYIMLGIPAVVMPSFDAGDTLCAIETERVTSFFAVPTMINAMVSHPDFATRDLSSLTRLISAGGPLPLEVFQRVRERGIGVLECFGTSESGGGIMHCAAEKDRKPDSVGRPMVGFEVRIVDDEGRPVPDGEVGEFIMRGDPVASGYYKQPDIEADIFRNGWFHTGDYGRGDADGFFYVMDRKKDMVKTGGLNVFPKDVEERIYALPGVRECSVLGLPHAHWGEAVTAFVAVKPGCALNEAAVIAGLRESLSNYQIPKAVVFLDELPKTIFGKLSKLKLREDYENFYRKRSS